MTSRQDRNLEDPSVESIFQTFQLKINITTEFFLFSWSLSLSLGSVFFISAHSLFGWAALKGTVVCKVNGSSTVVCTISQKCRNGLRCLLHPFQNVHRNHIFIGTLSRAIFNHFSGSRSALEVILGVLREFQTHKYYCFRCLRCFFLAVS